MNPTELQRCLTAYVAVRQSLGYAMRAERTLLVDFVRFVCECGTLSPIRAQGGARLGHADKRAARRGRHGETTMARRFLLHLRATYPDTEIPALNLVVTARRPMPYLFTEAEVTRLIEASRQLGPRDSLRAAHVGDTDCAAG
jgi:hypothetical protein